MGFHGVDLDYVMELLNLYKEELFYWSFSSAKEWPGGG
jgi:hypothetical protein